MRDAPSYRIHENTYYLNYIQYIRKTGSYTMIPKHNQLMLLNENDLRKKVVDFIRKQYPDALISATLGELKNTVQ